MSNVLRIYDRSILDTSVFRCQVICLQCRPVCFACCGLKGVNVSFFVHVVSNALQIWLTPPSTGIINPVIQPASLLERNKTAVVTIVSTIYAKYVFCIMLRPLSDSPRKLERGYNIPLPTSHPVPSLPIRFWLTRACLISGVIPRPIVIGV